MNGRELDLRHLEIFAHVVAAGGITPAARVLGLKQPTVSGHIRTLEEEVGTAVVHRGGGRAKPTAAGDLLYRYAKQICELKDAAQKELETFLGLRQGELKIGASTTPATYLMPPLLARFAQQHPAIQLELEVGDTRAILDQLEAGAIEIAIVGDEVDEDRYRARRIASDRIVLAVGKGHPWFARKNVDLSELKGATLITREAGSATLANAEHALADAGLVLGRDVKIALRLPTNEAIRESIARGIGIAFLPHCCLVGREADVHAIDVVGLSIERPFMAVTSLSRETSPAAKKLLALLR